MDAQVFKESPDVLHMRSITYPNKSDAKAEIWRKKQYGTGNFELELIEVSVFMDSLGQIEYMAPRRVRKWMISASNGGTEGPMTINMGNMPVRLTESEETWVRKQLAAG